MIDRQQAVALLERAQETARLSIGMTGAGAVGQMRLRPSTFISVLRADPELIQWVRDRRSLQHTPHYGKLQIEITDDTSFGKRAEKTLDAVGRTFLTQSKERTVAFVPKPSRWMSPPEKEEAAQLAVEGEGWVTQS